MDFIDDKPNDADGDRDCNVAMVAGIYDLMKRKGKREHNKTWACLKVKFIIIYNKIFAKVT